MFSLRSASALVGRALVRAPTAKAASASFSCEPAERIKCIFEEYRREHFSREIPSRFRKELLKGASIPVGDPQLTVEVERLNDLLRNIGHESDCLSASDMDAILDEATGGHERRVLPVEKVMQLI